MAIPTPTDDDQQHLLQLVWDLCVTHSRWPASAQVDRRLDRDFDLDVQVVGQKLPAELLYPPLGGWLAPDQELRLTIAGARACSGTDEDVRYFLEVVRFAAELERSWPGRPTEETDEPILKAADVVQRLEFPASGREALLTRLGLLLEVERWGWQTASRFGSPDWQFVLSRQVRQFRGVKDLDQYWSIRTRRTEQPSSGRPGSEGGSMATADRIFISHAWADRKLADLLRDTLVLGGVPRDRIFYSSSRATGIPSGSDVRAHLRSELQRAGLVIELISATFLTRPICLLELGGAWALGKSTYPIVVPPLTRSQAVAKIGEVHMGQLGSDGEIDDVLDELQDRLRDDVGLSTTATAWNPMARKFKEGLPAVLAALTAEAAAPAATSSPPPPSASSAPPAEITVDNYTVASGTYGTEVHGEATNNDTVEHSVSLKATFYDESGKIVGTADGVVNQLAAGDTKTFTLMSANTVRQYARFKVQVDAIL